MSLVTSDPQHSHVPPELWKNGYWHSFNDFLTHKFGEKVYKITVSAGFTCPTRDGTKGTQGCAFCDERGSSSFHSAQKAAQSIAEQIQTAMPQMKKRFKAKKFLAYFQSFTNTYGPLDYLQSVYDSALNIPDVIGMAIGTRPDCIPNEVLSLVNSYGRGGRHVCLELGLQSLRDEALAFYDRGHTAQEGIDGVRRAMKFPNLHVAVHLMFGAPGDTVDHAIAAAKTINSLGVHAVKIHQLMVLKNTVLATRYAVSPWKLLTIAEYNAMAMAFLEHLDPRIHVERTHALTSHADELVGPDWSSERFLPMNHLKDLMRQSNSRQAKLFSSHEHAAH